MSPSGSRRRQPARTSRPSRGRGSRMPAIWSALVVMAVWSIATGAYFAFRDDVTNPMTEMQMTYEKRIADVRAQFASAMSQQLLDKERIQQQLNALLQWQATLEQHASAPTDHRIDQRDGTRLRQHSQWTACHGISPRHASIDTKINERSPPPRTAGATSTGSAAAATWCRSSRSRRGAAGSQPA